MSTNTAIKTAYLHSALRRQGYTFARAMATPCIRACLIARAKAADKRSAPANQQEIAI